MRETVRLGRVLGVEIGVHWTVLLTTALIAWTLAASVFPSTNPGLGNGWYVAMAIVATLVFFVTLLLHELGHAVQAHREGVAIDGITLWLFGGVARLRGEMPSAGSELRIAIAGPLVTLALSVVFLAIAFALPLPSEVDIVVRWLGYINASLLVFNMLPAYPLDGGRVLRAALWARSDIVSATRRALEVARVLSSLLIVWGVLIVVTGGVASGVWLALIGWFLLASGSAEQQALGARTQLGKLVVADLMAEPIAVRPDMTLETLVDEVAWRYRHASYPVVDHGRPVGLLPFHAIARVPREAWGTRCVADCMAPLAGVPIFALTTTATEALARLSTAPMRRGLVVSNERLVGIITLTDLIRALDAPPSWRARSPRVAA